MAKRKDERRFIALPAIAFGTDVSGQHFRQPVCTLDLSAHGARISNFRGSVSIGQELTVELRKRKLQFRVVWCGEIASATEGQIGLVATESLKTIPDLSDISNGNYVDTWSGNGKSQKPIYSVEQKAG